MKRLEGKKIAVLVENGFEQVELTRPVEELEKAGAEVKIISPSNKVKGWNHVEWGDEFKTDVLLQDADPEDYHALLLPGGVMNPDKLRMNDTAVDFVRHFTSSNKPIASICHGPWTLIETGFVKGKRITSYSSIKTDLVNAGADWVNEEEKEVFCEMVKCSDPHFLKWAIDKVINWDGKFINVPILHIHGSLDYIFPINFIKKPVTVIKGGSHYMVVNRATEINEIILKEIRGLVAS